jgi:hypothetical protein
MAPHVVTQKGTKKVKVIFQTSGKLPCIIPSPWFMQVSNVPTTTAVFTALINVPPPKASSAKLFIRLINISIIQ